MKCIFPALLLFSSYLCFSQGRLLKGRVTDINSKPVISASVFLSNTSSGTKTNDQGYFQLTVPEGKFDLVVSSIGYETFTRPLEAGTLSELSVKLQPKAAELENIVIEPFEKDGWQKWGRFFIENFIGTSAVAGKCEIKNAKAIRFRYSKSKNLLTAIALEPLIIENKALGYRLEYQLELFSYDFKSTYLSYLGYPFFQELGGGRSKSKKWEKAREEVYYGSMMHFMRALYRNKIKEEKFEVRTMEKLPNIEKERVKIANQANYKTTKTAAGVIQMSVINADSAAYYQKILSQDDVKRIIGQHLLPGDSIAFAIDNLTAGLEFKNYLLVIYPKQAPPEYIQRFPKSSTAMMSEIILINGNYVEIQSNGSYYDPLNLSSSGYWGWSEKIGTMLPFDYKTKQ